MKLSIFSASLLAGLFFLNSSFGQSSSSPAVDQNGNDLADTLVRESPNGDTVEVAGGFEGRYGIIKCWFPKEETLQLILDYVESVVRHEIKVQEKTAKSAEEKDTFLKEKKGMEEYLHSLKECRKHRYALLYNANHYVRFSTTASDGRTILIGDAGIYRQLKDLARIVIKQRPTNILFVQDYLIMNSWGMHPNHNDGMYVPIISAEDCARLIDEEGKRQFAAME